MATEISLINYTNQIAINLIEINDTPTIEFVDVSQPTEIEVVVTGKIQSDKHYTHTQTEASTTWTINHNLKKYPAVEITDTAHDLIIGEITFNSINQITINFVLATAGKAFLN